MKHLNNYVLLKTKSNNYYFYSDYYNHFLLIQPIMYDMIKEIEKGIEINKILDSNSESKISLNKRQYPKEDVHYYYNKFLFLKQNKFFTKKTINWGQTFSRDMVKYEMFTKPNLVFETTTECNLNCEYCGFGEYYDNYGERDSSYISFDIAKKIIDYTLNLCLKNSGARIIYINIGFYGGEPLLNIEFIKKVVNYVRALENDRVKFKFNMSTNCLLLGKYKDFLYENDFALFLSLDGNEYANSYRKFHNNKPSFEKIFKNIKLLQKTYPEYFSTKVKINAVMHNRNSLGELLEFFEKEFSVSPMLSQLSTIGIAEEKQKEFKERFYKNPIKKLNRFKCKEDEFIDAINLDSLGKFHHNINTYKYHTFSSLTLPRNNNVKFRPTSTCNPFNRKMFVTTKGEIFVCEKIGREYLVGKIDENGVFIDFDRIEELYKDLFNSVLKLCDKCYRFSNCETCIFELIDHNGQIKYCKEYVSKSNYPKYLSKYLEKILERPDNYSDSITKYYFS